MIVEWDIVQGEPEWFQARSGVLSASNFGDIFTPKGRPATGAKVADLSNKIIAEIIAGKSFSSSVSTKSMRRGIELEPEARSAYELATGNEVSECGLIYMDESKRTSCSPDGFLIEDAKGLEIKCPSAHTQIEYLLSGKIPNVYIPQVQGSMFVTGFDEWDFMSYHPDLPDLIITVKRDDKWIKGFETVHKGFLDKIESGLKAIQAREKPEVIEQKKPKTKLTFNI